jgi:NAD-dependent SIR2 family protein deacetylase
MSHIITQNIDGLHSFRGDLDSVTELHGAVRDYGICEQCKRRTQIDVVEIIHNRTCPLCGACGAVLKPPVAFFGDVIEPEKRDRAVEVLRNSSLVITIGTHMAVDPVLSMVTTAKQNNSVIVQINLTPTAANRLVDVALQGKADDILGAIGRQLMPDIDWDGLKLDEWAGCVKHRKSHRLNRNCLAFSLTRVSVLSFRPFATWQRSPPIGKRERQIS